MHSGAQNSFSFMLLLYTINLCRLHCDARAVVGPVGDFSNEGPCNEAHRPQPHARRGGGLGAGDRPAPAWIEMPAKSTEQGRFLKHKKGDDMKRIILASLVQLLWVPVVQAQQNQTTATLASFPAPPGPGFYFASSLLQAADGNLYGAANQVIPITIGGITTYTYTGTVFRVAPDGTLTTVATIPTLERSENQLGFGPYSSLVQDANGNFYGTTY